ncbi:hypothetical protein HanHA300_Chr12g0431121 [Helianthus annuus]|nr:hypothetical protein HanHA300_Chr12g0431121 [Helianthus annuus]
MQMPVMEWLEKDLVFLVTQVFMHLGKPRGWRRSSNQPWPQHPVLR